MAIRLIRRKFQPSQFSSRLSHTGLSYVRNRLCRIKRSSLFDSSLYFRLNEETGVIDYDRMDENAKLFRPKLIVAGASAYAKLIDYKRMRDICDRNGAWLLSDMAHISGALLYQNIMVSSPVLTLIMRPDLSSSSNILS